MKKKQADKLLEAINWLMGCSDSFEPDIGQRETRYWWRRQFREKSGIVYDSEKLKYRFRGEALSQEKK